MYYPVHRHYRDFQRPLYSPTYSVTWQNHTIRQEAMTTCHDSFPCLFDAAVTNDVSFALVTLETDSENNNDKKYMG